MAAQNEPDAEDTFPPGTELGRYQIIRLLGRGGMGAVYEANHRDLKKRVAIKTLHPALAAMPEARTRFLREGEAASRIRHPNVVDVTDVATQGSVSYMVMEFLEGEDLSSLIARTGALSIARSVEILLPVFGAIAVAHDEGVIRRDLKPENIFLVRTRFGGTEPKVLDFGISKMTSSGSGNTLALTGTGATMGTPYYIAPEQVRSAAGVDARSDQYALGAILYECVTGHRAHEGSTIYEVIRSVGDGAFLPPRARRPDTPPDIERAILRAMSLEPAQRFPSIHEFARAILPFASDGARARWTPSFAGGSELEAAPSSQQIRTPQPGGAEVFSATAPSGVGIAAPPPPAYTTLGSSAVQATVQARTRRGWLAGGVVALAAAAAVGYVARSPASHPQPALPPPAAVTAVVAPAGHTVEKAPERYHVSVAALPGTAAFDLDGTTRGTGRIDEQLAADGTEHALTISAPGFVPARLTFRDHPPADHVTLEPIPAAPRAVENTAPVRPKRTTPRAPGGAHEPHAPATVGKSPGPLRTGNNAAILDN